MSGKLFEAKTFNLKTLGVASSDEPKVETPKEGTKLPNKEAWAEWEALLETRLKNKGDLTEYDVESDFFKEFFNTHWGSETGNKLDLIGTPLKKVIRVIGFDPKRNPALGFILKPFVIDLINKDKLNADTFKAIYNAIAKKLITADEFIRQIKEDSEYNIIYCTALYDKTSSEIEKYLKLQSEILTTLSDDAKDENKKVFLKTSRVSEPDPEERAKAIKKKSMSELDDIKSVTNAALNSIELAKRIKGKEKIPKVSLDGTGQNKIVDQVNGDVAKIFATLLSLSIGTGSKSAKKALSDHQFSGLSAPKIAEATLWLSTNNIIPKGQLQESDAESLVNKLLAVLAERLR